MIEILLARRLQRIRKRRFLFVRIEFYQPFGFADPFDWTITGVFVGGRSVQLSSAESLRKALYQAERYADARWNPFGVSLEKSA